jgi:hypothetical protein
MKPKNHKRSGLLLPATSDARTGKSRSQKEFPLLSFFLPARSAAPLIGQSPPEWSVLHSERVYFYTVSQNMALNRL